ncbi:MAG: EamA family transporter [Actinobacteria bacterium]|nr:EamA family transporter [Actinomycetota bacterium]
MTAAFARRSPAAVAAALATIYLVWGSTYLAIRVTDRTMPPLLMSSVRFLIAGTALYAFASRGRAGPTLRQWGSAAIVGAALLLIGNGGVAWAETRIESGLAALMVAIIPLWVALMDRAFFGRRLSQVAIAGLVVGFAGVALLVRPGGGGDVVAMLALVGTTAAWAGGSLYARGAALPESPLLSASMQMLTAGIFLGIAGLATGETSGIHADTFSTKPLIAFVYLVIVGSLIAFSAYAWLLKNVRISIVSTYAFVNPVVAVALGTVFLNESIGWTTVIAGAAIVIAVVSIVTARAPAQRPVAGEVPEPLKAAA